MKATTLTDFAQYESLYELFQKAKPVSLVFESSGPSLLLNNGTFLHITLHTKTIKAEGTWKQLLGSSHISSWVVNSNFPCVLSLSNGMILFLTSNSELGHIRNTQGPDLNSITFKLPGGHSYNAQINSSGRILLMTTISDIQVIGLNNKNEMLAFSPFSINVLDPLIENSVFFSNKYSNLFYYIDTEKKEPTIKFGIQNEYSYIINKGIIDQREIIENFENTFGFDAPLISIDISREDEFLFLTNDGGLHYYTGAPEVTHSTKVEYSEQVTLVRWHVSGHLVFVLTSSNQLFVFDKYLHPYQVNSGNGSQPCLQIQHDPLFPSATKLYSTDTTIALVCGRNVAMIEIVTSIFGSQIITPTFLVKTHLKSGQVESALDYLRNITDENEFTQGFVEISSAIQQTLDVSHIQRLVALLDQHGNERVTEHLGKYTLCQLGYRLLEADRLEDTYRLAYSIKSTKLMNSLAFYAEQQGLVGLAMLAKVDRGRIDEHYSPLHDEVEKVIALTGKKLTMNDYKHILHDLDEILNITRISEAQDRGSYLVEKNFWEINLEEYSKGLIHESQGKYNEALEVYKALSVRADIQRIESILQERPLFNTEQEYELKPVLD